MIDRNINGIKPHFRPFKRPSNPYRMLLWLSLVMGGVWLVMRVQQGTVKPLFLPTPTPTRTGQSYTMEAEARFLAGDLNGAISAYQEAVRVEPADAQVWAELARIQTYSSSLLSTDQERYTRMEAAKASIDQALTLAPDDSIVHAIHSFVLDWFAFNPFLDADERLSMLGEAEAAAVRALQLDPENGLALAFYAEILVDQQKWSQAEGYVRQAALLDPASMDVHRVYGYVWESLSQYRAAIDEYLKAAEINPNLTFLYIFIGRNFLTLKVYPRALEYFENAVRINEQLGIKDPVPYIEIAKTYTRNGEFFIAALNAEKALMFNPTNANTYGQLGIIYTKARNYEGAKPALKCAVSGCSAEENETARELLGVGVAVQGLPLISNTVAFYYLQYGSVLAAMSRPNLNYCPEALAVLEEVRIAYPDDTLFAGIIQENEAICALVAPVSQP